MKHTQKVTTLFQYLEISSVKMLMKNYSNIEWIPPNNIFLFYWHYWYIWTNFQGDIYFTLEIHYLEEWQKSIIERQSSVRRKGYCRSKIHYTYYKQLCISLGNLKRRRLHIFCVCLIWLNDVQSQLHNQGCFISLWEVESQFEKSEIVV